MVENIYPSECDGGKNIDILSSPSQFYQCLKNATASSKSHIIISTLYVGDGMPEMQFLQDIHDVLKRHFELKVTFVMDYNRYHRGHKRDNLIKLVNDFYPRCRVFLYKVPLLEKFPYNFIPSPIDEILGVYHCKFYLFDDKVIVSGSNLSTEYFESRQDRYFVLKELHQITEYLKLFTEIVCNYSYELLGNNTEMLKPRKSFAINQLRLFTPENDNINKHKVDDMLQNFISNNSHHDTIILPLLQHSSWNIYDEEYFIIRLLSVSQSIFKGHWSLTTPYPSIPNKLIKIFKEKLHLFNEKFSIIVSSNTSHGFANNNIHKSIFNIKSLIPILHNLSLQDSIFSISNTSNHNDILNNNKFEVFRYDRDNWTYHAKGLWLFDCSNNSKLVSNNRFDTDKSESMEDGTDCNEEYCKVPITYIGSSNFSDRSWYRDFELGFLLVTKNKQLQYKLYEEWKHLCEYAVKDEKYNIKQHHQITLSNYISSYAIRIVMKFVKSLKIL